MQASGGHLGKAAWISPARIHGTRRIRQKQCELPDDGNLDGRRLRKALGERNEWSTLLEHHPRPDRDERRCRSATRGERHECMEPCRDFSSLRQRPEPRSANHQLGRAPRIGPLRECSFKLRTPPADADVDQPAAGHAPRQHEIPALEAAWLMASGTGGSSQQRVDGLSCLVAAEGGEPRRVGGLVQTRQRCRKPFVGRRR
jgi:hypothetical protein